MRFIEIDGERYDVPSCMECPCYSIGDGGWGESCRHPKGDGVSSGIGSDRGMDFGLKCPLREKEEFAKGGLVDPVEATWSIDVTVPRPEEIIIPLTKLRGGEEEENHDI